MAQEFLKYIVDENQQKTAVIITIAQWQHILEELEELDDIRAYGIAKDKRDESLPFEQAVAEIKREEVQ